MMDGQPFFRRYLSLLALVSQTTAAAITNQYFDKTLPDNEAVLTVDDFTRAKASNVLFDSDKFSNYIDDSAMYRRGRFEGDIINSGLRADTIKPFMGEANPSTGDLAGIMRNAVKETYLMWPNGKIPYTISTQYSAYSRSKIAEALDEYAKQTCIQFVPKTDAATDYVHIFPEDGCYSLVGRTGGKQPLSLGDGCIQKGIIIHELMHAVGFFHEQSRADRDDFINIIWANIEPGLEDQFEKYSLDMITHLGTQYDYGSIMHYSATAFSKNGKATIEPKKAGVEIGQRKGFSANDLYKIKKLYNCADAGLVTPDPFSPVGPLLPTPITPVQPAVDCVDKRRDCDYLAKYGHCNSRYSANFMNKNCPRSCKQCGGETPTTTIGGGGIGTGGGGGSLCTNSRSWCDSWSRSGMCTQDIFREYMQNRCPQSCGFC